MGQAKDGASEEVWLKRQALQVVMQLPDDMDEALAVLRYAETLVKTFLADAPKTESRPENVVQLIR
ncbi:hypothetical protein DA075_10045 [Methylobacterium currus]|uniref:Uncharacterized protein n=1 Tax=Methylobacterium currus TaxID=2051553 RepID=A0A2R4WI46_9HYPH|nr:hypothetical protein DA075_10045 [Methylobacterium currus]